MYRRRYDDVVRFVASILFGASFGSLNKVISALEKAGCTSFWAIAAAAVFFLVYFRNVHGLIAYDLWAEYSEYEPFELRPGLVAVNFGLGVLSAIFLPFLFIYVTAHDLQLDPHSELWLHLPAYAWIGLLLIAPIAIYSGWDLFWLRLLTRNPDDRLPAYKQIRKFTERWLYLDAGVPLTFVCAPAILQYFRFLPTPTTLAQVCGIYAVLGTVYLIADYASHMDYYFPRSARATRRVLDSAVNDAYEFDATWDAILPDKAKFCHWGGKEISLRLVKMLNVQPTDRILELCCGQGGTLGLLPAAKRIVGVDIFQSAIDQARAFLAGKNIELEQRDAHDLTNFDPESFDKVYSQDGDAWLHPAKHVLMAEIFRVSTPAGLFIYQSYVSTRSIPDYAAQDMARALRACGYTHTDVCALDDLPSMFEGAGFRIISLEPLHDLYASDNARMLKNLELNRSEIVLQFSETKTKALEQLLTCERDLFENGWWSGVLVTAKRY